MKNLAKEYILPFFLSFVISLGTVIVVDYYAVVFGAELKSYVFLGLIAVITAIFFFVPFLRKRLSKCLLILLTVMIVLSGLSVFSLNNFMKYADYEYEDNNKNDFFSNHKVMVIVPHQDDDINLLGSNINQYIAKGSDIYVVFTTNGDYYDNAEIRYNEAINHYKNLGVPEKNIIFLGYGDTWDENGPHIYNANPGEIVKSHNGKVKTYGTKTHPSYNGEKDYTAENYFKDLKNVILEHKPDVIFCNDFDYHEDHRATSMAFEKVMGNILKENKSYKPTVYKGYAYSASWWAPEDFYSLNSLSVKNMYNEPEKHHLFEIYDWNKRVRIPVIGSDLSRTIFGTEEYKELQDYESQNATEHIFGICSSDEVFWKRRTDSLGLNSNIKVSSGNASFLNDFMLLESTDVSDYEHEPFDGVWIPEDDKKEAVFELESTTYINEIVLYDNPSLDDNVLDASIIFDDGTKIKTGELNKKGIATSVPVNKDNVSSFTIKIEKTEGKSAGLTEVEAFDGEEIFEGSFISFMDEDENFVYDYYINKTGIQNFKVYKYGYAPDITKENYDLTFDNNRCSAEWVNSSIRIECPVGEECSVTLTSKDGKISNTVHVKNPNSVMRFNMIFGQKTEAALYQKSVQNKFSLVRIWNRLFGK